MKDTAEEKSRRDVRPYPLLLLCRSTTKRAEIYPQKGSSSERVNLSEVSFGSEAEDSELLAFFGVFDLQHYESIFPRLLR